MDDVIDDLVRAARRCERTAVAFTAADVEDKKLRVLDATEELESCWSGSWIGYQSRVYTAHLRPRRPGEHFDSEWGAQGAFSNTTAGEWAEYDHKAIVDEIFRRARVTKDELAIFDDLASRADRVFQEVQSDLLATIDAALSTADDKVLATTRETLANLTSHFTTKELAQSQAPTTLRTRDSRAFEGGINVPAHVHIRAEILGKLSYGSQLQELAKQARYVVKYLEKRRKMSGKSIGRRGGKIFIGHGGAQDWRELKDFVQNRLQLDPDEFNRVATAGMATKERLETMLDDATFALLIMTAEDERVDGTRHARANVIHEVGLFQGRLGFERAIILLEEGCEEFSNVFGIMQLRFPPRWHQGSVRRGPPGSRARRFADVARRLPSKLLERRSV